MIYALDTNTISYILNGNAPLAERLDSVIQSGSKVFIPLIVYYEVRRGLLAKNATSKMNAFLKLCTRLDIDGLTIADMNMAATIYAENKQKGRLIEDTDLLIAAQCVTHGYVLVTHNIKHFEGIKNLEFEDWINA